MFRSLNAWIMVVSVVGLVGRVCWAMAAARLHRPHARQSPFDLCALYHLKTEHWRTPANRFPLLYSAQLTSFCLLSIIHWYTGLCSYTFSDILASIHVLFCLYQVGTFQKIIHSQFQCNKFENGSDLENLIRNNFKILVLNLFKYYIP